MNDLFQLVYTAWLFNFFLLLRVYTLLFMEGACIVVILGGVHCLQGIASKLPCNVCNISQKEKFECSKLHIVGHKAVKQFKPRY
uniref:Uncharacterized protein n=1 Tax=Ixodes ricinus TaxID=34613 RepID=A0A6B0TXH9_IXORI